MSTLSVILIILVVLIAAILIYAATRPDTFSVERSTQINAPAAKIFPLINDFDSWARWSPWEKKDPAMKRSRSGPPTGQGAVYAWEGNKEVGQGRMEIIDTAPPSRIRIKLDFFKPFEAHNSAEFTLVPKGEATEVRWVMQGPSPFMFKLMGLFLNMDKMVGKDFEAGLASMKAAAEA